MNSFNTYSDALVFVQNSYSPDFEWGGNASAEGLASYLFSWPGDVSDYLRYVGENPSDYGLSRHVPERSPERYEMTNFSIESPGIQLAVHDAANNEYSWLHVSDSGYVDAGDPFSSRDERSNAHRFTGSARVAAISWFRTEHSELIDTEDDICAAAVLKKMYGLFGLSR